MRRIPIRFHNVPTSRSTPLPHALKVNTWCSVQCENLRSNSWAMKSGFFALLVLVFPQQIEQVSRHSRAGVLFDDMTLVV
jgi:hypothetical protein